jgi:hypothetical protein
MSSSSSSAAALKGRSKEEEGEEAHGVWYTGHWCGAPGGPAEDELTARIQTDVALGYEAYVVHPLYFEKGTFDDWPDLYFRTLAAVIAHFLMSLIPWLTGRWGWFLTKHPYVMHFGEGHGGPLAVHFRWDASRIVRPEQEDCVWALTRWSLFHYLLYYATLAVMAAPSFVVCTAWLASGWLKERTVYFIAGGAGAYVLWIFLFLFVGKLLIRGPAQPIRLFICHGWYLFVSTVQFWWSFVRLLFCCGGPCCCCGQHCPFPYHCPCQRRRRPLSSRISK